MAVRLSFTLDPELSERIDEFAKSQDFDRNEAVLRLLEAGLLKAEEEGFVSPPISRDFREAERMQKNIDNLMRTVDELKKEIRVMHHMVDLQNKTEDTQKSGKLFKKQ
ncbi:MAG TPA: type II secretion system protein E [Methanocorpusculum sp.]|nr:type II secretion system protein E [Methanocorpusculum sp.]